ncbi:MAG: hypothetical protein PWQ70_2203 [Clostridiales bacterium]|nr:hypothetical protein [Clostridiales bacterium]
MNTKEFLKAFHGGEKINFRAIGNNKPINANGYYNDYMVNKLSELNKQGYNIYFVVNGGGTKKPEINKINAVFIDFDCGRNENKNYYPLEVIKQYKINCLDKIKQFRYKPSIIVETRNGLHVYWLVNKGATIDQFIECQLRLIQYFGSDAAVKTPERVMRVPGYYWTKDIENKFMCEVIKHNYTRYDITEIINGLPEAEYKKDEYIKNIKNKHKNISNTKIKKKESDTNYNIQAIRELNVEYLKSVVNTNIEDCGGFLGERKKNIYNNTLLSFPQKPKYIATTRFEVYDIINKIDLADFLGIDNTNSFRCILHDDNNPSAGIFKGKDGSDIYKCHSSNCGFTGGIIKIVEKLANCNKVKAINFIKEVYKIELIQSDWQKEQIELLELNKEYILSGKMEEEYPELWKYVKPRISKLICLIDLAIKNTYDEELSYNNLPIFFAGTKHLQNIFETKSMKTVSNTINLFALLNLINKIPVENIPKNMLNKAKHIAATKKYKKLPNHFQVPSYCTSTLEISEEKARTLHKNNFSMKGISREWVIRTFGVEIANEIYPQFEIENKKGTTKASDNRTKEIAEIINALINSKDYATEKEVIEILQLKYGKTLTQIQIKRSLQEILDSYNLKRIRCNKEIKERYRVSENGYPFIIVKKLITPLLI